MKSFPLKPEADLLGYSPLPTNSLIRQDFLPDIQFTEFLTPAPLDEISQYNGCLKFVHNQKTITSDERSFLLSKLHSKLGVFLSRSSVVDDETIEQWIVPDTSPGWPYTQNVGSTKEQVLDKISVKELLSDFDHYSQVVTSTLKMELRRPGKDARLFRPAPISSVVKGIQLFALQNHHLLSAPLETRIAIGIPTPGLGHSLIWDMIYRSGGPYKSADGSSWDANFPLWAAELICEFRSSYLPGYEEDVERYYQHMYCGSTNVNGMAYPLIGNPSGHYNTSTDNSLLQLMMMWLLEYQEHTLFEYFVCGDDLIIGGLDVPDKSINDLYNSHGMYLEFLTPDQTPFYDLVFVGTHPVKVDEKMRYAYDEVKQLSSCNFRETKGSILDYYSKLSSIAANLFYTPSYKIIRGAMIHLARSFNLDPTVCQGLWEASSEFRLIAQYSGTK